MYLVNSPLVIPRPLWHCIIDEWVVYSKRTAKLGLMSLTKPDFRLPPRYKWDLRSSGMLRNVDWDLDTDVSGQSICPILRVKRSKKKSLVNIKDLCLKMLHEGCKLIWKI
jgi:hypothetical protein